MILNSAGGNDALLMRIVISDAGSPGRKQKCRRVPDVEGGGAKQERWWRHRERSRTRAEYVMLCTSSLRA